jgi:hypothetical protein
MPMLMPMPISISMSSLSQVVDEVVDEDVGVLEPVFVLSSMMKKTRTTTSNIQA